LDRLILGYADPDIDDHWSILTAQNVASNCFATWYHVYVVLYDIRPLCLAA